MRLGMACMLLNTLHTDAYTLVCGLKTRGLRVVGHIACAPGGASGIAFLGSLFGTFSWLMYMTLIGGLGGGIDNFCQSSVNA
jgi:hypothetical protein